MPRLHVVAEIVEAELVVGPVGDVRVVGGLRSSFDMSVWMHPDGQPEKLIDLPHPLASRRAR